GGSARKKLSTGVNTWRVVANQPSAKPTGTARATPIATPALTRRVEASQCVARLPSASIVCARVNTALGAGIRLAYWSLINRIVTHSASKASQGNVRHNKGVSHRWRKATDPLAPGGAGRERS